jgi:hypothetical protein
MILFVAFMAAFTLWLTWLILNGLDWTQSFVIFDRDWFGGIVSANQIY